MPKYLTVVNKSKCGKGARLELILRYGASATRLLHFTVFGLCSFLTESNLVYKLVYIVILKNNRGQTTDVFERTIAIRGQRRNRPQGQLEFTPPSLRMPYYACITANLKISDSQNQQAR
jgi:hypothetical protein